MNNNIEEILTQVEDPNLQVVFTFLFNLVVSLKNEMNEINEIKADILEMKSVITDMLACMQDEWEEEEE